MISQRVELVPAAIWTCPECGIDQFERMVVVESDSETMQQLRETHGVEPWQAGEFLQHPEEVVCNSCERAFHTEAYGE